MKESGEALYRRFLAGDNAALEALVGQYSDALVRFACGYVGDTAAAEDVMADTFAVLIVRRKKFREEASFGGYTGRAELYLSADGRRVSILSPVWRNKSVYTAVIGVDVSDPLHPAEIGRTYLSGNYLTSRMVGGDILLINTLYIPKDPDFADQLQYLPQVGDESGMQSLPMCDILLPENANAARYTVVCRVDGADYAPEQTFACFSYSETAYVSQENIFLTHGYTATVQEGDEVTRTATTDISCLAYTDGTLSLRGTATVKGSVKDQYSMDEENGILRVATSLNTNITASAGDGENMTDFISRRTPPCIASACPTLRSQARWNRLRPRAKK